MVAGKKSGQVALANAPAMTGSSCVCHAPSQLPKALQPGGDACPAPRFTLTFPFLLGRGRRLDPKAKDIQSGDAGSPGYQEPGWLEGQDLGIYRRGTDEQLIGIMKDTLRSLAGEEGVKAVDWFVGRNGAKYTHGPDDPLTKKAQETRQFVTACHTLLLRVREAVSRLAAGGREPGFAGLSVEVPRVAWGLLDIPTGIKDVAENETALKAIFGGTQGEEIWVTALKHDRRKRAYALRLRWLILDHFGVDTSDLYHGSLYAFYVLQHERGYRAYVNELVVERWMTGTY
jgi:hypothetical protein